MCSYYFDFFCINTQRPRIASKSHCCNSISEGFLKLRHMSTHRAHYFGFSFDHEQGIFLGNVYRFQIFQNGLFVGFLLSVCGTYSIMGDFWCGGDSSAKSFPSCRFQFATPVAHSRSLFPSFCQVCGVIQSFLLPCRVVVSLDRSFLLCVNPLDSRSETFSFLFCVRSLSL